MKFISSVQINSPEDFLSLDEAIRISSNGKSSKELDNIISEYYMWPDEDPNCDFSTIDDIPDSDWVRKLRPDMEFTPGVYFIWIEDSKDRLGDICFSVIHLIPNDPPKLKDVAEKIKLMSQQFRSVSQKAYNPEYKKQMTKEDIDILLKTPEKLDEIGFSYF